MQRQWAFVSMRIYESLPVIKLSKQIFASGIFDPGITSGELGSILFPYISQLLLVGVDPPTADF